MILEADMNSGEYREVANERGALFKAEQHSKDPLTCVALR
jgi:hypothetical protein